MICTHRINPACGIPRFLSRFARRAGLVHLRQTFVLRCHGDGWPLRVEAWHFSATTSSRRMVRTIQCPTYSTISPHRVPKGLARIGIAAAFTMSSLSRARDSSFERHGQVGTLLFFELQDLNNLMHPGPRTRPLRFDCHGLLVTRSQKPLIRFPPTKPRDYCPGRPALVLESRVECRALMLHGSASSPRSFRLRHCRYKVSFPRSIAGTL